MPALAAHTSHSLYPKVQAESISGRGRDTRVKSKKLCFFKWSWAYAWINLHFENVFQCIIPLSSLRQVMRLNIKGTYEQFLKGCQSYIRFNFHAAQYRFSATIKAFLRELTAPACLDEAVIRPLLKENLKEWLASHSSALLEQGSWASGDRQSHENNFLGPLSLGSGPI